MLSLLLDENISPIVANKIKRKRPDIKVISLYFWENGKFLGIDDDLILVAANELNLTLVTYDLRTIPPLLVEWGKMNKNHAGIIFIDHKSIPSNNFGVLVRSLIWLFDQNYNLDWKNRLIFLQPDN